MSTVNAVYYPSWKVYQGKPPSCLNVEATTHILYAFIRVNEDGSLRILDQWGDLDMEVDGVQGCLAAVAKLKEDNPHIRTLISVGGGSGSDEFPALAADADARGLFAQQIREFCDTHHFDGVDIDWEHPTTEEQGQDYLELLRATREAIPAPDYLVTTALPVGEYCLQHIDLAAASEVLDLINLMAYDFVGGWTGVCGHHAQLSLPGGGDDEDTHPELRHCCAGAVDYMVERGVPGDKIVLGVPAYARFFPGAGAPGQEFSEAGEVDYCDLPGDMVSGAEVDEGAAAASYVDDGGRGFVTFDVPATVAVKARFAKERGLAGLFYWTGVGDREGDESLVAAGFAELTS